MTSLDAMALVAGVAVGFVMLKNQPGLAFLPPGWILLIYAFINVSLWLTTSFAVVALARTTAYRRLPHAAEWLAILLAVSSFASWPLFNVDSWVNEIYATFRTSPASLSFDTGRWLIAGMVCVVIAGGLAVIRVGRTLFPPVLKTVILAGLFLLGVAGPLWAFGYLGDDLVSPSAGFGPGDLAILHRTLCGLVGYFPQGVVFAVPIMATLIDRLAGVRWSWHEWACAGSSTMLGLTLIMLYRGEFDHLSLSWLAERGLVLTWLIGVALLGRWMVIQFARTWNRWISQDSPSSFAADPSINL